MAHERPWYKRNGGAMVLGSIHMPSAEHKWAYSVLIDMMNDREAPLPDDAALICGLTGLSKRRWREIREYLLNDRDPQGDTRIMLTERGDLTNPRFARELAEREETKPKAVESGRRGGKASAAKRAAAQGDLGLTSGKSPEKGGEKVDFISGFSEGFSGDKSDVIEGRTPKNNDLGQGPPQAHAGASARQSPEIREEESQPPPESLDSARADGGELISPDDDLLVSTDKLARAGAVPHDPTRQQQFARNIETVRKWKAEGIDLEAVAKPAIIHKLKTTDQPSVGVLDFYTSAVRKAHRVYQEAGGPPRTATPEMREAHRLKLENLNRKIGRT